MSLSQILLVPGIGQPPLQELQSLLFAGGQRGGMWLFSELSSLFQDTAGSTPVTTSGQTIGRISDLSGNGNHATQATAGSRPAYDVSGSLRRGSFDGTDDFLQTAAIDFSNSDKLTIFVLVRKNSNHNASIAETSVNFNVNNGSVLIFSISSGTYSQNVRSNLPSYVGHSTAVTSAPSTALLTSSYDLAGTDLNTEHPFSRLNGVQDRTTATSLYGNAGGNFGNFPLFIGRRGGTSLPFNGLVYGLIMVGGAMTLAKIERVEAILSAMNVGA